MGPPHSRQRAAWRLLGRYRGEPPVTRTTLPISFFAMLGFLFMSLLSIGLCPSDRSISDPPQKYQFHLPCMAMLFRHNDSSWNFATYVISWPWVKRAALLARQPSCASHSPPWAARCRTLRMRLVSISSFAARAAWLSLRKANFS